MKKQRLIIESIRYITGNQKSVKIQGKTIEVKAFQKVLNASRNLYENLQQKNAKLAEIEKLVEVKNQAAKAFKKITGKTWPL
jgi:hypothetical protein|tara:strand:- start:85 stop:330 length:246 start_codon:yes stop_codon:yes gene_type:complete